MLMPSSSADTAIAPRMRQYEHVQRRAERSPSVSLAVNRTPPQWQAPLIGSMEAFMHGSFSVFEQITIRSARRPRVQCERPLCLPPMTASAKRERRQGSSAAELLCPLLTDGRAVSVRLNAQLIRRRYPVRTNMDQFAHATTPRSIKIQSKSVNRTHVSDPTKATAQ